MHLGPAIFKLSKSFPNALPAGGTVVVPTTSSLDSDKKK